MLRRTITVTGTSEIELSPDIIEFTISMKEYWKEEFESGKKYEDYITKIPMSDIEPIVLKQLEKAGVKQDQIKVSAIGNYHRQTGKDFLVSKTIVVTVSNFEIIDEITKTITDKGINNMSISNLQHSQIEDYEKNLRITALENAEEKAGYLLHSLAEKCGEVISISETNVAQGSHGVEVGMLRASSDHRNPSATELRKITRRYTINATFAIAK